MISIPSLMGILYYSSDHMYNISQNGNIYVLPPIDEIMYLWKKYKIPKRTSIERDYRFSTTFIDVGPLNKWEPELVYNPPNMSEEEEYSFYPIKIDIDSMITLVNMTNVCNVYPVKIVSISEDDFQYVVLLPQIPGRGVIESTITVFDDYIKKKVLETTIKTIEESTLTKVDETYIKDVWNKIDKEMTKIMLDKQTISWKREIIDIASGIIPKNSPIDSFSLMSIIEFM